MHKIYALFDFELNQKKGQTIELFIKQVYKTDAVYLQYRDKVNPPKIKIENLKKIRELWSGILIANDDISLIDYCDGLHLGQDDMFKFSPKKEDAVKKIRTKIKDKILGLSTHNKEEILEANGLNLDYIGLGAYRDTNTKDVSNILGNNLPVLASFSKHKVAAIGGVKKSDKIENVEFLVLGSDIYED
jgi:thiamine-phosphate pyrophosphorylase